MTPYGMGVFYPFKDPLLQIPRAPLIDKPNDVFGPLSVTDMVRQASVATYKTGYTSCNLALLHTRPINQDDLTYGFQALQKTALQSVQETALPMIFSNSVQIVPDDYTKELTSSQIKQTEMGFYIFLFSHISRGVSAIQFAQNSTPKFKQLVLDQIQKLLSRPAGRLIILSATRANIPIVIEESQVGSSTVELIECKYIQLKLNTHINVYNVTLSPTNDPVFFLDPLYLVLGHELIHALHFFSICSKLGESQGMNFEEMTNASHFFRDKSRDPAYNSVAELLTIEGPAGFPSENMLNYEFGCPPRYGHISSSNIHEPILKIPNHGLAYDPQKIGASLNQALMFGDANEFRFIYPFLSSSQIYEAIVMAVTTGCMPILHVLGNDIKNLPQNYLLEILTTLLPSDAHTNSLHFLFTLVPNSIDFINPETGWMPIHLATLGNCINNVKMLIGLKKENLFAKDSFNLTPCMHAILSERDTSQILRYFFECNPQGVYFHLQSNFAQPTHPNTAKFLKDVREDPRFASFPKTIPIRMNENVPSPKTTLAELNGNPLSPRSTLSELHDNSPSPRLTPLRFDSPSPFPRFSLMKNPNSPSSPSRL